MRRNDAEQRRVDPRWIVGLGLVAGGTVIFGPHIANHTQPPFLDRSGISGSQVPGASAEHAQERSGTELLMANPLLIEWRKGLPDDATVIIKDFGQNRSQGSVYAQEGLKMRVAPHKKADTKIETLAWGEYLSWRYQIIVEKDGFTQEEWIVKDELVRPIDGYTTLNAEGIRKYIPNPNADKNIMTGNFVARFTQEDGVLITSNTEPSAPMIIHWRKP